MLSFLSLVFKTKPRPAIFGLVLIAYFFNGSLMMSCAEDGFNTYIDTKGRFSIEYPSTMTVDTSVPDELTIFHPSATLRIRLNIIDRPKKSSRDTKVFIDALKQNLREEFRDAVVLEEGHSSSDPSQAYILCSFTDKRGVKLTQLTQVYLAEERILQLIISDKPEGFKNLGSIINRIRNSLKILKPFLN